MTHNRAAVDLLASRLAAGLVHPGDPDNGQQPIALPLPGLSSAGIPPEMAEQFARDAGYPSANIPLLIAEALVHLIETDGDSEIVRRSELATMRAATKAAEPQRNRQIQVHCHCGTPLFTAQFRDFDTDKPRVAGPELIKAMSQLGVECATAHRKS